MGEAVPIRGSETRQPVRERLQPAPLDPDQWGSLWRLYETLVREVTDPWSMGVSHHVDGGADIHITVLAPAERMQRYTRAIHRAFVESKLRNFCWDDTADDLSGRDDGMCEREHYICCVKRRECKT